MHRRRDTTQDRRAGYQWLLPQLAMVAVITAIILACTGPRTELSAAPANKVQLSLSISDSSTGSQVPLPADKVWIAAEISTAEDDLAYFSGGQTVACEGVKLALPVGATSAPPAPVQVPRQQPGDHYTCVYTDEQGQQTTITIPVPMGQLVMTSPQAGATVPIPSVMNPQPTPAASSPAGQPPRLLHQPFPISYTLPDAPQGAKTSLTADVGCPQTSPQTPSATSCEVAVTAQEDQPVQSGTLLVNDTPLTAAPARQGYADLVPGPGAVQLSLLLALPLAPQGLAKLNVALVYTVTDDITWVAAA